jgi:alkylation response protein AidB-like acyl-CoA dehydrogenase
MLRQRHGHEGDDGSRAGLRRRGLHQGFPVERYMRDATINQIFEGTSQIHRLIVARQLLAWQG